MKKFCLVFSSCTVMSMERFLKLFKLLSSLDSGKNDAKIAVLQSDASERTNEGNDMV